MNKLSFLLFLLLAGIVRSFIGQEIEPPRMGEEKILPDADFAASLLQALVLNNHAIDRYDVLVTRERVSAVPGGEVSSFKSRYRLLHDRQAKNSLMVSDTYVDDWADDGEATTSKRVFGFLIVGGEKAYLRDLRGILSVPVTDLARVKRRMSWPTFTTLGLETFPDVRTDESSSNLYWERVFLGKRGLSSVVSPDSEITVKLSVDNLGHDSPDYKWIFDQSTMVPRFREGAVRLATSRKRVVKERDRIEWKEMSNVYVPVSIKRSELKQTSGKEPVEYEIFDSTQFTWNVVAGKLDNSYFSVEKLKEIVPEEFLAIPHAAERGSN